MSAPTHPQSPQLPQSPQSLSCPVSPVPALQSLLILRDSHFSSSVNLPLLRFLRVRARLSPSALRVLCVLCGSIFPLSSSDLRVPPCPLWSFSSLKYAVVDRAGAADVGRIVRVQSLAERACLGTVPDRIHAMRGH